MKKYSILEKESLTNLKKASSIILIEDKWGQSNNNNNNPMQIPDKTNDDVSQKEFSPKWILINSGRP